MAAIDHWRRFLFVHNIKTSGHWLLRSIGGCHYSNNHAPASWIKQRFADDGIADHWKHYYKFSIVRHPYTLLVSLYRYLQREPLNSQHKHVIDNNGNYVCFDDFIANIAPLFNREILGLPFAFYSDQYSRVTINDNWELDRIFKFENREEINRVMFNRFRVKMIEKKVNQDPGKQPSIEDICEKETIATINRLYQKDFENFGYSKIEV